MVAKHKNGLDAQAACRAVLAKLDGPGAHGDGWTQGQTQTRASRHGVMAEAGNEAWQGKPMQNRRLQHNRPAGEAGRPLVWFHQVWRECGGAGRSEGGLGPSLLSPPTLSPLPVAVHTHSLNLPHNSTKFSPSLFLFPFHNCLPNPLYCLCPASLSCPPSLLPTPTFPLWRGIGRD